jgi:hypothetical protein
MEDDVKFVFGPRRVHHTDDPQGYWPSGFTDHVEHPVPHRVVILQDYPEEVFGSDDLSTDHLFIVHGPKQDTWDLVHAAVEVGFIVTRLPYRRSPYTPPHG